MNEEPVRILVVDDELGVREGCRKILSVEGYQVTIAEDGQAGWEAFQAAGGGFAVLLVDLMMPRMTGLELMKLVREADPDVLPIIITAHATIDTAVEGTKQGAYSYIPKPFTPDELLLAIKNGLERRALTIEARRLREERERRLLEVAAERSKSNTIIKCITDGILVINTEKLIVLRNAAAARILSDTQQRALPPGGPGLRGGEGPDRRGAGRGQRPDHPVPRGEPGAGHLHGQREPGGGARDGGEASGAVAVFRDITALKKLETAKSMFVSMVAHEVKNPLAAAEGWLNLILSGLAKQDPEEEKRMIERSLLRIRTLRTLVTELLNITAIQTGNFTLRRSPVEVGQAGRRGGGGLPGEGPGKEHQLELHRGRQPGGQGPGRSRRPAHGLHQPDRQRHQVHPRRGARGGARRQRRHVRQGERQGRRHRHGAGGPGEGCSTSSTAPRTTTPPTSRARAWA